MGPLEILWATVAIFFIFIAFVRGYSKELGVTTMIFAALFLITYFGEGYLPRVLDNFANFDDRTKDHLLSSLFSLIFIGILFASYAGVTFGFYGNERRSNPLLNFLVGGLNGYLVAGTLWYFQDRYLYPAADLGLLKLPLSNLAETLANFLPPYVVPPMFWAGMILLMLLFRVRG